MQTLLPAIQSAPVADLSPFSLPSATFWGRLCRLRVEADLLSRLAVIGDGAAMNWCNYGWFGTEALALLLMLR